MAKALGVLMGALGMTESDAFAALQRQAAKTNQRVSQRAHCMMQIALQAAVQGRNRVSICTHLFLDKRKAVGIIVNVWPLYRH